MLGGGILMFIASILDWRTGLSGLSTTASGLLGIITLLTGAEIAAVGGLRAFGAGDKLPDQVLGVSVDKWSVIMSLTVFFWTFGMISGGSLEIGIHLTWIGAAIATAGGVLAARDGGEATAAI